jgi:hypothetical protein
MVHEMRKCNILCAHGDDEKRVEKEAANYY